MYLYLLHSSPLYSSLIHICLSYSHFWPRYWNFSHPHHFIPLSTLNFTSLPPFSHSFYLNFQLTLLSHTITMKKDSFKFSPHPRKQWNVSLPSMTGNSPYLYAHYYILYINICFKIIKTLFHTPHDNRFLSNDAHAAMSLTVINLTVPAFR